MAAPPRPAAVGNVDIVLERTKELLRTTTRRIQLTKDIERAEIECDAALLRSQTSAATEDDRAAARRALGRLTALRADAEATSEREAQLKVVCSLRPGDSGFDGAASAEPPTASDEELASALQNLRAKREAVFTDLMQRAAAAGLK